MSEILLEQAIYHRATGQPPMLVAESPGFLEAWQGEIQEILIDFGERPVGIAFQGALFALPLGKDRVVVVRVDDQPSAAGQAMLCFHVMVLALAAYRQYLGDPFALADRFPPPWEQAGSNLPTLSMAESLLPPRTVAEVCQVLKRVKAGALREDEDPETVELTEDNAESPALLGGVQVLVDGGKLVFVRPAPDTALVRGLWTLLPASTRSQLWPATFAFSNALGFDVVVLPRRGDEDFTGYTTEEQAANAPAGRYELNLQTAAEAGDQAALDMLFGRRSSSEMMRLAVKMLLVLTAVVALLPWLTPRPAPLERPAARELLSPAQREAAAVAAAMVANRDPWAALALQQTARYRQAERFAVAAGMVGCKDPWAAAVQARVAQARYVEVWKVAK